MKSLPILLLAVGTAVVACATAGSARADVTYISQTRTVSASAMLGNGGSATAPDYGPFNQSVSAQNELGWGNGAGASQHSTINATRLDASGSQSANGGIQLSWGRSSSVFDVTFSVDTPTVYTLYGYWEANPSSYTLADAGVELTGPTGTIYASRSYRDNTNNVYQDHYDLSGKLEPGVYHIRTYGSGYSSGYIDSCSSNFGLTLLFADVTAGPCQGEWLPSDPPKVLGVNGPVYALTDWDPDGPGPARSLGTVTCGNFSRAGLVAADNIAVYDPGTVQWTALGSGTNGVVYAVLVAPNGDLVVGGDFTIAGGVSANHLARWNGTAWSALGTGTDGVVRSLLLLPNGDIIAGGAFGTAGGVSASNVARWNGSTWSGFGIGLQQGRVLALAVLPNGDIYAGGDFIFSGEDLIVGIARWNGSTWSQLGAGVEWPVFALKTLPNGDLAVGGLTNDVMRWNGAAWSSMGSIGSYVNAFTILSDGSLVAAGWFDFYVPDQTCPVSRLNGSTWTRIGTASSDVNALASLPGNNFVVGGTFTSVDSVPADHVARWYGSGWVSLETPFGLDGPVLALAALPNGDVVAGGDFSFSGASNMNAVTRWDGANFWPLAQGLSDTVHTLLPLPGGDLLAGGDFTSTANGLASHLALWHNSDWSAFGPNAAINGRVSALALLPNGNIVIAGEFTTVGSLTANHIARWDGTQWTGFGTGFNHNVAALAVMPNGDVVAAGLFTMAGTVSANRIARWNGTQWVALGTGLNDPAYALAVLPNGDLVAGGLFNVAGGGIASRIARWDGAQWSPIGLGMDGMSPIFVSALAVWPNGDLVAGGKFQAAGNLSARCIARWNGKNWTPLGAGINDTVSALAVLPSGDLVAGGSFTSAGDLLSSEIARYNFASAQIAISQQPAPAATCHAGPATFVVGTIPADNGDLAFRWQFEAAPVGSELWTDLADGPFPPIANSVAAASGSESNTLTITNADLAAQLRYRVVVSVACGGGTSGIESNPAALLVCIGDYNCDGGIDGGDVQSFFTDWEAGLAGADVDGDGGVDGEDVETFFVNWENGC
ncbi:MAG: WD40 repeat domain-containing protein [Planctomycetes bacterium]|nr:WD40 repeat domain-containing protein [Planctomycetota bacterium]